ncbi:hypothetical protein U14_04437 [Candidatus Moduliflexus flocculans]|uniref:SnoaL-like domain-containing protein n=1 Tax=Candidatus Moduliflexus flocculans TaxID=1499966 RepID=A0A0S6W497_9BACT|nr:hypothetical protein U14_04437 [Candidatus Moduliflexus flocculans]
MKRMQIVGLVVIALVTMGFPFLALAAEKAAPDDIAAPLMEMIQKHDKALNDQDLDTIMSTYAPDGTIVMMGTGPGEAWAGKEEIADAYKHFFMDYDAGTLTTECTWHKADQRGNIAWLIMMCNFTDYLKNVQRQYALNISTVFEQIDGQWYFRTFHFSNLTNMQ